MNIINSNKLLSTYFKIFRALNNIFSDIVKLGIINIFKYIDRCLPTT